ncbi:hypothetical protein BDF19DRAFT_495221 [Syncephalis fuscata]|nr:hypothetical protein BDF19DRAFT_495221 [Syncephalis fuscata]
MTYHSLIGLWPGVEIEHRHVDGNAMTTPKTTIDLESADCRRRRRLCPKRLLGAIVHIVQSKLHGGIKAVQPVPIDECEVGLVVLTDVVTAIDIVLEVKNVVVVVVIGIAGTVAEMIQIRMMRRVLQIVNRTVLAMTVTVAVAVIQHPINAHRKLKKDKKGKKSSRLSGVIGEEFGKHGILRETDVYTKEQEFHAWLIEVKHLSPEVLNQQQMKQHFKLYMEDYNTASMPHEKYYNMEKWEKSQYGSEDAWGQKMKGSGGDSVSAIGSLNLLRDEEQLRRQRASGGMARSAAPTMTKEQVEDLRRVQGERIAAEKLRKMGYQPKESMGVRYE